MVVPQRAAVEPMPPRAIGALPWVGAGLRLLADPAAFFAGTRDALGDTYVVDAFGYRLLCVFSPTGVQALYALPRIRRASGWDRFDPAHYDGRRLSPRVVVPAKELVSTFGHGSHSCPAQRFAVTAIRIAVGRLITRYDLTPHFASAEPRRRQLGAVARAESPCMVAYRLR